MAEEQERQAELRALRAKGKTWEQIAAEAGDYEGPAEVAHLRLAFQTDEGNTKGENAVRSEELQAAGDYFYILEPTT